MKRNLVSLFIVIFLTLPVISLASGQQGHDAHGGHGGHAAPADSGGHSGLGSMHDSHAPAMAGQGESFMLGEVEVDGVKAMAHVSDVSAMMAKAGRPENFHLMLMFADSASGAAIGEGVAAVKIQGPGQQEAGKPVALIGMAGHFGADLQLSDNGVYTFEVGTKLADGKKRQYQFQFEKHGGH